MIAKIVYNSSKSGINFSTLEDVKDFRTLENGWLMILTDEETLYLSVHNIISASIAKED